MTAAAAAAEARGCDDTGGACGDDQVLLAALHLPVVEGADGHLVVAEEDSEVDVSARPWVLSTRFLQEWLLGLVPGLGPVSPASPVEGGVGPQGPKGDKGDPGGPRTRRPSRSRGGPGPAGYPRGAGHERRAGHQRHQRSGRPGR